MVLALCPVNVLHLDLPDQVEWNGEETLPSPPLQPRVSELMPLIQREMTFSQIRRVRLLMNRNKSSLTKPLRLKAPGLKQRSFPEPLKREQHLGHRGVAESRRTGSSSS